ncbi:Rho termination factor N-terminal domain-containing protein [Priestia megaterium]|uniref:Rho termination factor N-terminal domain-containing protein n=1 Tax=Priestia megaterium TaxID=1404 RepID=UPI003D292B46
MMNLTTMNVKDLRKFAGELNIPGRWDMNKGQLISAIERKLLIEEATKLGIELTYAETHEELRNLIADQKQKIAEMQEMLRRERELIAEETEAEKAAEEAQAEDNEETPKKKKNGRTRVINVFKDGELIETIEGLMQTFNWVTENNITNVGWVKRSLKTGEETNAGYKYKVGGYKFEYAN